MDVPPFNIVCSTHYYYHQVVGQALMAAQATMKEGLHVHSLHSNFLYQGKVEAIYSCIWKFIYLTLSLISK